MKNIIFSGFFLALGIILPFLTGQIPQFGAMLLPMHIPVFLCAFICNSKYSVPMAAILPVLRTILFGKPNLYPEAVAISFELATYAFFTGFFYRKVRLNGIKSIYVSLILSMILGRTVRGIIQFILLKLIGITFTFRTFYMGIVIVSLPGILIQLIIIPFIVNAIKK